MLQLALIRHSIAWVTRDKLTGGWVHRYRRGTVVSPTPRGLTLSAIQRNAHDVFFYAYTPRDGDVVVEIGAEYGTETIVLSRAVAPTGRVIAIEAHPWTCSLLERTVDLNAFANVTPLNAAVVGVKGPVMIEDAVDARTVSNSVVTNRGTVVVDGLTLDDVVDRFGITRIDLLKVNIEGAERELFDGAVRSMPIVANVVISCHDFKSEAGQGEVFGTGQIVDDGLARLGWEVSRRLDDPRPWVRHYRYASNPAAS